MSHGNNHIHSFSLSPGRRLAGKYVVRERLGAGWEGEVYHITEGSTGIERAAKLFFPKRNPNNRAVNFYAKKLDKLKECSMVIRYHTNETIPFNGSKITMMVSDYVEGEILADYVKRQRGKRLRPFAALHLLHTLALGIEQIHSLNEYHGDLHDLNIIVNRVGLGYRIKLVDFYHWGRCTAAHKQEDLCSLIRIFYDVLVGAKHYANHPPEIRHICLGLRRSLIIKQFRTVSRLCRHLETMSWS